MSSSIDERVVAMRFQDNQFASGIKRTLDSLGLLKKGLNLDAAKKSLADVEAAGKRFNLGPLGDGVDKVNAKFLALAAVAITALANIANRAVNAGIQIAKSLTIDPIKAGFAEYELKMNSIQTILANTSKHGTTLNQVTDALDRLNDYADKTIYNFGDMTRNIGLFTNAGIGIEDATSMIKGFSNEAASSGTSAAGAAGAAYQLSQALSAGMIRLMDWRSLTNVGMGSKNMQEGLIQIADAMGTFEGKSITAQQAGENFNASLEKEWLTAEVMTNYLKIQAGELSDEQLRNIGLSNEQIVAFKKQSQVAQDAATKVRTFTGLLSTLRESVGSAWSETFDLVIGDFDQATELWTNVNNTLGEMITASGKARNQMLTEWKDLGGREVAIEAISNAFNALMSVIKPIKEAFREIFPPTTGQQLYNMTVAIRDFTQRLKMSEETMDALKRTFKGVFAVVDIVATVIRGFVGVLASLFGEIFKSTGGVLAFTAGIGDFLVSLRDAIKEGEGLNKFFEGLKTVLKIPLALLAGFASALKAIFGGDGIASDGMELALGRIQGRLEPLRSLGDTLINVWKNLATTFQRVREFLRPLTDAVMEFFGGIGSAFSESVQNMDFSTFLDTINTGLLAGLVLVFKKFLSGGVNVDLGGGFLGSIKSTFEGLTGVLKAMQTQIRADALMKIAAALGILTLSVVALSLIDSAKLTSALTAMTVMFTQLVVAMALLDRVVAGGGVAKIGVLSAGLILLSTAILILSAAVRNLASLDWEGLAKGLTGVIVLLGSLAATAKLMSGTSGGLIRTGAGLMVVAVAVKILASAVKDFAALEWQEMIRGFAGVSAALVALGLFTRLVQVNRGAIASSAGLILLGVALKVIASAVGDFAGMDWDTLGRGFVAMGAALLIIAAAVRLIPMTIVITASGLVILSAALVILAQALQSMGGMSWEQIAKGLVTLAGALLILAGGLYLMSGALPGAAALIVVAGALAILTPVLLALGGMSWAEIGKGLATLAGAFLVLGVAGLVLGPLVPILLGLGLAVALLGAGALAAGAGILAFSVGITMLAAASAVGTAAVVAMVSALIGLIPMAMKALAQGIVLFVGVIANSGPAFVKAITTVLMSLLQAINKVGPAIITTLFNLVMKLVNTLATNVPKFVDAGLRMITGILNGIANNVGKMVTAATNIVVNFINGISQNLPRVIQAGVNLIINFVNSLANAIRANTSRMDAAGRNLASAIIQGMTRGIFGGISTVVNAAKKMASNALNAAKNFLGIDSPSKAFYELGEYSTDGYALALIKTSRSVEKASAGVGKVALTTLKDSLANVSSLVATDMDMSPTIRPVLDLTDIRRGSGEIKGLLAPAAISPEASYSKAATIAIEDRAAQQAMADMRFGGHIPSSETTFTFVQNNNSPKALSTGEIYRNTKNQISVVKGALPK